MMIQKISRPLFGALVAGAALTFAGSASAEPFSGPYAGIGAGIGILESEGSTIAGPFDRTQSDAVVTGIAGYRMPLGEGPVVLGVEGDAGINVDTGDGRYGLSGIAGVKLGEASLVYGRAGYGWRDGMPGDTGKGLVLGGGFETRLTEALNLRVDYRHHDLGSIALPDNTADYAAHEVTGGLILAF